MFGNNYRHCIGQLKDSLITNLQYTAFFFLYNYAYRYFNYLISCYIYIL